MNKKVVVFGGGRSLSILLRGLREFPIDLTVIVNVSDDGGSTGKLRSEFNIPAMGDIRGVMTSLSSREELIKELLEYRFHTTSDLNNHTVGNLILTAATDITGSMSSAVKSLSDLFKLRGSILPVTDDVVSLVARMTDGTKIEGEHHITEAHKTIEDIWYKSEPSINDEVLEVISSADLLIFGIGSLYTSIVPNILPKKVKKAVLDAKAKKMYICNAMTQYGETENFTVSDCVNVLNKYMGGNFLDVVVASTTKIPEDVISRYKGLERKSTILIDQLMIDNKAKKMPFELIQEDLLLITEEGLVEHDPLKTAFVIFSYMMKG